MSDSKKLPESKVTDDSIMTRPTRRRQFLKAIGAASALTSVSLATAACSPARQTDTCRNVVDRDPFDTSRRVCDGD